MAMSQAATSPAPLTIMTHSTCSHSLLLFVKATSFV